jgi:fumarate reductase subunit C
MLCDLYRYVYEGKEKKNLFQQDIKEKWQKHKKIYHEYQDTKTDFGFGLIFFLFLMYGVFFES